MSASLPLATAYFLIAGITAFTALFAGIAGWALRIGRDYARVAVLSALVGVRAVLYALIFACPPLRPVAAALLCADRVLALASAIPALLIAMEGRKPAALRFARLAIGFLASFALGAVASSAAGNGALFRTDGDAIRAGPLYAVIYAPLEVLLPCGSAILLALTGRSASGPRGRPLMALVPGIAAMAEMALVDAVLYGMKADLLDTPVYGFGAGAFFFSGWVAVFALRSVREQFPSRRMGGSGARRMAYEEDFILKEIYAKATEAIRSKGFYLDSGLTVERLADLVNESPADVSRAVNRFFGSDFRNYLNSFRVEEMKRLFALRGVDGGILEIGIMAGFDSRTTINRAFYKETRMTPARFRAMAGPVGRKKDITNEPGDER